jgi:tetratricopeptide (TPR) repeat protein
MLMHSRIESRFCSRCVSYFAIVLALTGCSEKNKSSTPSGGGVSAVSPAPATERPSDDEVQTLIASIESHVDARDIEGFNAEVDWNAILDRALDGLPLKPGSAAEFRKEILRTATSHDLSIIGQIFKQLDSGGSLRLLRVRDHEGGFELLYRLIPDTGVTYYAFRLAKQPNGKVLIVDIYPFISSEYFSAKIRHGAMAFVEYESRNVWQKLTRREVAFIEHSPTRVKMKKAALAGRFDEAWQLLESLPEEIRYHRSTVSAAVMVGQQIDEGRYAAYLERVRKNYPNDPSLDLTLLDLYGLKKQWNKFQEGLDRLDQMLGGDPYLDVMRGLGYDEEGKHAEAKQAYASAIKALPDEEHVYWFAIASSRNHGEFADMAARLDALAARFGMTFENLETEPVYAEFVKSPEYAEWKKAQVVAEEAAPVDGEKQ